MCGGNEIKLVVGLTPTPIGGSFVPSEMLSGTDQTFPLDLYQCRSCGYVCLMDVVNPELLFSPSNQITSMSLGVVEDLSQLATALLERQRPPQGSLIVDIGSNDGTLLRFFQEQGMRVLGVEPASFAANRANESGINTICDFFSPDVAKRIKVDHGRAKIITANRVFANIDRIDLFAEGLYEVLDLDGVFAFETAYVADLVENSLVETIYHEHLGYDSVNALDIFFSRHGLKLVDVERIALKGGALRGVVQRTDNPRPVSSTVAEMKAKEIALGIAQPDLFKDFKARIDHSIQELGSLLLDLKNKGKSIAGYGASVGTTTLIYHFGLGDVLSFLVDDDPQNQHRFSPGHHIPVYPTDALYERNPDYVVLIAWRYAEQIMNRNKAYLQGGGHFILPLPELRVI